ncbi:hypothetical protein Tco_0085511 [Tanacetum coccineum]
MVVTVWNLSPVNGKNYETLMRCHKTPSKFAKSLTSGALILWGRSRLQEGTSTYSWLLTTCQNGSKQSAPHNAAPSCLLQNTHRGVPSYEASYGRRMSSTDRGYENSLIYKEKTKRIHDAKIKNCVFNVGDRVLLFNSRLKIFSGKLKSRWSGPFTIVKFSFMALISRNCEDSRTLQYSTRGHILASFWGIPVSKSID